MKNSDYKNYSDLTLDELEALVQKLENMSLLALKQRKKSLRITILNSVKAAIKEIEKRLKKQYNNTMLIGVVGLIGSGKGTVSDRLMQKHGFRKSTQISCKKAPQSDPKQVPRGQNDV